MFRERLALMYNPAKELSKEEEEIGELRKKYRTREQNGKFVI